MAIPIQHLSGQDLIVTVDQDSLNCKIVSISSSRISYVYSMDNGREMENFITRDKVLAFERAYYVKLAGSKTGLEYPKFVITPHGGFSYRTAKSPETYDTRVEQYLKSLKSGYNYGIDLVYYFSNFSGLGLKYNAFRSSGSIDNFRVSDGTGGFISATMKDDITITFIGPFWAFRMLSSDARHSLIGYLGLGYLKYHDDANYLSDFELDGNTLGMVYDLAYEVGLTEGLSLGAQFSLYSGIIREFEFTQGKRSKTIELDKESLEGMGRFDVSLRLAFRF